MVNEELKEAMIEKIENEEFGPADILDYMTLFCEVSNESEEIQEEIDEEDFRNKIMHFFIEDGENFTMKITDMKFSWEKGHVGEWDATLKINAENFAGLLIGEKDGQNLYMNQELEAHGGLPAMIKFQTIARIVTEELED